MPTNVGNAQLLARLEPALIDFVDMDERLEFHWLVSSIAQATQAMENQTCMMPGWLPASGQDSSVLHSADPGRRLELCRLPPPTTTSYHHLLREQVEGPKLMFQELEGGCVVRGRRGENLLCGSWIWIANDTITIIKVAITNNVTVPVIIAIATTNTSTIIMIMIIIMFFFMSHCEVVLQRGGWIEIFWAPLSAW